MKFKHLAALFWLTVTPAVCSAQTAVRIMGTVSDSLHRPLGDVVVQLATVSEGVLAVTRTDSIGNYVLAAPVAGRVTLRARRLGYKPYVSAELGSGEITTRHDIVLAPLAQQLTGITVRATSNGSAFAARAAAGIPHSHFADSLWLASQDRRGVHAIFDRFSGTSVHVGLSGNCRNLCESVLIGPRRCPAIVFVDGWRVSPVQVTRAVKPTEIRGIEVYDSPANAPPVYRVPTDTTCSVVFIWTAAGFTWETPK